MRHFLVICIFWSQTTFAFKNKAFYLGLGDYFQNSSSRTTQSPDASPSFFGTNSYPFKFRYDLQISDMFYSAPQFWYTLFARNGSGNSSKITMMHFVFPIGSHLSPSWEWSTGPGLMLYEIKGAGSTKVLNNGTSTATFSLPARTVYVKTWTWTLGVGYQISSWHIGFDLISESLLSSAKRSQNFMFSLNYRFGG